MLDEEGLYGSHHAEKWYGDFYSYDRDWTRNGDCGVMYNGR